MAANPRKKARRSYSRRNFLESAGVGSVAFQAGSARAQQTPAGPFVPTTEPRKLLANLYLLEDTCNVYLVKNGSHGVLIDFGSGRILDYLPQLGVSKIDWILHTHHHRDQAQGDAQAVRQRIPIAVPAHERHLFEEAENFWRNRRIYHLYYTRNDFFTLTHNIPVAGLLRDYDTFRSGDLEVFVLPSPGHTLGSVTLMASVDGQKVAFSGDLMHSPGKIQTIYDLQVTYGMHEGVDFSVYSLSRLAELKPQLLWPSHGEPISDPLPGISELIGKLSDFNELTGSGALTIKNMPIQVSPHLIAHAQTTSSFYAT